MDDKPGPRVSISHSGGRAVALASTSSRVGVDLEQVVERHPAFVQDWFSATERAALGPDAEAITSAWACKEAVLKALGAGMALNPRDIEVLSLSGGLAALRLHGAVSQRAAELSGRAPGEPALHVQVRRTAAGVVAEARLLLRSAA